jgi:hypothetical protein
VAGDQHGAWTMGGSGDTSALEAAVRSEPWSPRSALGAAQEPLYMNQGAEAAQSAVQTLTDPFEPISAPEPMGAPGMGVPQMGAAPQMGAVDLMGPPAPMGDPGDDFPGGPPPRSRRRAGGGKGAGVKVAAIAVGAAVVVAGGAVAAMAMTGGDEDGKATVSSSPLADAGESTANQYALQQQRRKLAYERAVKESRQAPGVRPKLMPKGSPIPTKKPKPAGPPSLGSPVPAGEAQRIAKAMLPDFGMDPDTQFGCLVKLWDKESGWRTTAANPSSGAYGIPQALPGEKMASAGDDWRTSARTQIKWGLGYIKDRYDTPCGAWEHSTSVGWY